MLRAILASAVFLCVTLMGSAHDADAGGFCFKKLRKKAQRSVEKRADEIGDASRKLRRKVTDEVADSKVVTKTKHNGPFSFYD